MLARFLSPDPYVQAPDYTQGFNRYSYCYNNPFKYTDPSGELQIGPFYLSLNAGYSDGGFSFGISAGVGIEKLASAGISIGYNTSGSFTFSASIGAAGFYATGGFDTNGGWFAGAGWSVPLPPLGIVSFNTNMLGVSGSYSQNGGWSYNHMGMQISKSMVSFSPSVGVSVELYYKDYSIEKNSVHSSNSNGEGSSSTYPISVFDNKDETKAWTYMDENSKNKDTEYGALLTSNKILVHQLPKGGGNLWAGLKYDRILGKEYIYYNKERMKLIGTLHTHRGLTRSLNNFSYYDTGDGSDVFTAHSHQGIVFYLMTENKEFHSMIVIGGKRYLEVVTNINSTDQILDGTHKLIPVTKQIYNAAH